MVEHSPFIIRLIRGARYAVAVLLLWLVWRRVGGVDGEDWNGLDPWWLVGAAAAAGLVVVGWTTRWWLLLRAHDIDLGWRPAFGLTLRADFFNFFFLGPLGADGYRWLALRRSGAQSGADDANGPSGSSIFATVYLDHIIGLLGGLVLFGVVTWPRRALLTADGRISETLLIGTGSVMAAVGMFILLGVFASWDPIFRRFVRSKRWFRPLDHLLRPFDGARRSPGAHLAALGISTLSSLAGHTAYWCAAMALGLDVAFSTILATMPVADFAASVPVSVSGIGVREHVIVELLRHPLGDAPGSALLVSMVGYGAGALWALVGGLLLLLGPEVSWRGRSRRGRKPVAEVH